MSPVCPAGAGRSGLRDRPDSCNPGRIRAAFYEEQGPARDVLRVGELPTPEPGPGEVRVRIAVSGVHVGDVGKRRGYWGSTMTYPRVIPHGDGAGTIDAVGPGADPARVGDRVWVYLAQSYRPSGTAAEYCVVPSERAVVLPDGIDLEQGAVLGIPGITGHRAVFASGPVAGRTVLVTGPLGGVGRAALAVARRGGADVAATVRHAGQVDEVLAAGAHRVVVLGQDEIAPDGVDRVAEIDLAGNAVQYLSNDDFPPQANEDAARDLTAALAAGDLRYPIAERYPLSRIADAQDAAERTGAAGRVVVDLR